jgi:large subunit ribosomal protein L19
MVMTDVVKALEAPINPNIPELHSGDTVNVHVRIKEGDRERVQEFRGTIIRLRKGGNNANFTVRRTASHGIGVERTFLLRSPRVEKVEIIRRAHVRRAQLYFLRDRVGKRARLKEKRNSS